MTASQAIAKNTAGLSDTVQSILQEKGREVFSIEPTASVYEALHLMAEKEVGALLVVSEGRLAGLISERDYARKVILKGRSSHETHVCEIMVSPALTVTPDDGIQACMLKMTENRVRHLPVLRGDQVLGVISIGDLVKRVITAQGEAIRDLHNYIHGNYPI